MPGDAPSFDLVVATVGRLEELGRLLDSLERQTHRALRLIVVDQNADDRVSSALEGRELDVLRLSSEPGLSRARNAALPHLEADIVAFPDDDCVYASDLLERVAARFEADTGLAGLTGRAADPQGNSSASWKLDAALLTETNLWNRAISFTIFLRREAVEAIGAFDERLGLGSPEPWSSGEEIDYLVRALRIGARIEYDPALVVEHDVGADDSATGFRDGASVGYLLRKHGYPARMRARMFVRPIGGVIASLGSGDLQRMRFYAATLRGRLAGYRDASRKPH